MNKKLLTVPRYYADLSRRGNLMKSIVCYSLSFMVPAFIMFLILRNFGVYPFGEISLLHSDMNSQYIHFFEYFRNNILLGEGSVFFSWNKELGTAFMGLFAYYLASPFNLILIFFSDMLVGIFVLQVFKAGLCGLAFYTLIRYVLKDKQVGIFGIVFSTSYALMSYAIAFSMCIMWIDGLIFLPLIVLGAVKILENKRPYIFTIFVALMMISHFYIGYMVILMTVIFVIYYWITQNSENRVRIRRLLWRFSLFGAIGMSFALWVILPAMTALGHGRVDEGVTTFWHSGLNFPLGYFERSFMPGNFTSIAMNGLPHLYVGVVIFVFTVGFFITKQIKLREKLTAGGVLIFLLASFWINALDVMWHGFIPYYWFRHRQAFVFSFFMIYVAARFFYANKEKFINKTKNLLDKLKFDSGKESLKIATLTLSLIVLIAVGADLHSNAVGIKEGVGNQLPYRDAQEYLTARERGEAILSEINEHSGGGFYGVRLNPGLRSPTLNESLGFGFRGIGHYSSSYNETLNNAFLELGFSQGWIWQSSMGGTSVTDAIFGMRYVASRTPMPASYRRFAYAGSYHIYENLYTLPPVVVMMGIEPGELLSNGVEGRLPFDSQRRLTDIILGSNQNVLQSVDASAIEGEGAFYVGFLPGRYPRGELRVASNANPNESRRVHYFGNAVETHYSIFLGDDLNDVHLTLGGRPLLDLNYVFEVVRVLPDAFEQAVDYSLQDIEFWGSRLRGTINSPGERYVFASIPFDEGLQVRVDGRRVETERFEGAFIRFIVPEGESVVEIRFVAPGLNLAIAGGILGLLILGLFVFLDLKKNVLGRN